MFFLPVPFGSMRKLAVFSSAFAVGVFLAQYVLPEPWQLPFAVLLFLAAWAGWLLPWEIRRRWIVAGAAAAIALGYNWLYVWQVQKPLLALAETEAPAVMTLCDYAVKTDYGAKAPVRLAGYPFGKAAFYGDESLLKLRPGQTVSAVVRFRDSGQVLDTTVTTFVSKGVFLLAYGRGEAVYGPGTMDSLRWLPLRCGRAMTDRIQEMFTADGAGFLTAILTGDRSTLSEQALSDLSESGLYHIMAVSGMHCGFLLSLAVFLTGKHRRRLTAACAIPLLVFYAFLAGGRPSVVRACVMLCFLLAAPLFYRDSDPPTALSAALLLILLGNPFAARAVSLQLSFAAVAGLLWLTPRLLKTLNGARKHGRVFRLTAASFSATMGALVFTVPLSAWYFGSLVLVSPLGNLLCLWAAGLVFMLGLPAVLAGFLSPTLGALLGIVPRLLIGYILRMAHLLASIPYHALYFTNPYLKYWLLYAYLLFGIAYLCKPKSRRKYLMATGMAVFSLIITVNLGIRRFRADLDTVVLDVGQGQSVLLASGGDFALTDCGSANSWISAGDRAADQLLSMGCRRLDYLILTHYDYDHISGVTGLLCRLPVDTLLVPDYRDGAGLREVVLDAARERGTAVEFVTAAREIPLGRVCVTVYPPVGQGEDNEQGLAILAEAGENGLLITGDMDAATEKDLLEAYPLPDIEVLLAGHHGSKYSTSDALLDALQPEAACVSVGANRYGHPTEEVLARLARRGCAVYRTDLHGSVHFALNGEPPERLPSGIPETG